MYNRGTYSWLVLHWQSIIGYRNFDQAEIEFSIKLGLGFDRAGTNSAIAIQLESTIGNVFMFFYPHTKQVIHNLEDFVQRLPNMAHKQLK